VIRRALLLLALGVVLLAGTACSRTTFPVTAAATVNGRGISEQALIDNLEALAGTDEVRRAIESQGGSVYGPTRGTYDVGFAGQVLSAMIIDELVARELEVRGVQPTDEDRAAGERQYEQGFASLAGALPEDFRTRQVEALANRAALGRLLAANQPQGPPTPEEIRAYYDANIEEITDRAGGDFACTSHILVAFADPAAGGAPAEPTPEQEAAARAEAEATLARLRAGEDFAAVATEVSDDPGSASRGGDLGCNPPDSGFVTAFEDAVYAQPVGVVGEPVRTPFGYHLILVRSRGVLPFEEVEDDIARILEQERAGGPESALQAWLSEAAASAEVTVDPRWGRWDPEEASVVPPEGATPATLPPELLGAASRDPSAPVP
jgi:hypothetical protein